jgi:hypothetical protein
MAPAEEKTELKNFVRCKVYPGQFSDEYAVSGEQAGGERFSLFVPSQYVAPDREPTRDTPVEGWLQVWLWDQVGTKFVVKLPRESFESGRFVTVWTGQLRDPLPAVESQP